MALMIAAIALLFSIWVFAELSDVIPTQYGKSGEYTRWQPHRYKK